MLLRVLSLAGVFNSATWLGPLLATVSPPAAFDGVSGADHASWYP